MQVDRSNNPPGLKLSSYKTRTGTNARALRCEVPRVQRRERSSWRALGPATRLLSQTRVTSRSTGLGCTPRGQPANPEAVRATTGLGWGPTPPARAGQSASHHFVQVWLTNWWPRSPTSDMGRSGMHCNLSRRTGRTSWLNGRLKHFNALRFEKILQSCF